MRPFRAAIPRPIREGKAPKFKLISLKEHQIWENQYHELNTYKFVILKTVNKKRDRYFYGPGGVYPKTVGYQVTLPVTPSYIPHFTQSIGLPKHPQMS